VAAAMSGSCALWNHSDSGVMACGVHKWDAFTGCMHNVAMPALKACNHPLNFDQASGENKRGKQSEHGKHG
jgi:hypothetical protein